MNWYDEVVKDTNRMFPPRSFTPSEECAKLMEHFEGYREHAYQDGGGVWTVGIGTTKGVKPGDTMSYQEALDRKRKELKEHCEPLYTDINVNITQGMFDAMASFTYNVGVHAFSTSTLLKKLNDGDYAGAADELLRWNKDNGRVVDGLTRRRKAEREMFLGRDWRKYYA